MPLPKPGGMKPVPSWASRLSGHGSGPSARLKHFLLQVDSFVALVLLLVPGLLLISSLWTALTLRVVTPADFKSCSTPACELRIPKIIHQTYKTADLPDDWKDTPRIWNETHPGWRYEFWTDERNRDFIATNYPWFLEQFDAYPNGIQRADAIRYFILYHYGGVYADLDIVPIRNIEPMLGDAELVLPETPNVGLTNAFMAASEHNDFMRYLTTQLQPYANKWYHVTRHWQIITSTGPTFIWKMANQYDGPSSMLRVPASVWGKCLICQDTCPVVEGGYLRHLVGDSWHDWDSFFFTYILFCHQVTLVMAALVLLVVLTKRETTASWARAHRDLVIFASVSMILVFFLR